MTYQIDELECILCGECVFVCPVNAISNRKVYYEIDKEKCIECGGCVDECPNEAIKENE